MLSILFLTHRLPFPPDRGDRIRSYHLIRHLAQRHRISLASIVDHPPEHAYVRHLETLCGSVDLVSVNPRWRKVAAACYFPTTVPLTLPLFASPVLRARVAHRLRTNPFDLIFVYSSAMAQYVLSHGSVVKVIDFIDADSQKWFDYAVRAAWPMKAVYWREGVLLRRYERRVAQVCAHGFAASERETEILRRIAPHIPFTTIVNGVNLPAVGRSSPPSRRLVFTGVMDYQPNVDAMTYFVRDIFPLVRARVPDAELAIVGQRPTREVLRLGRSSGVTVTGWVPNVAPYLESAAVFVAPLRIARGVQNKILEAMAAGVAVVCSSAGLNGFDAVPGRDLLVGDTPDMFAAQVALLLIDADRREELRRSAGQFVRQHHGWDEHLDRLESVLVDVTERHRINRVGHPR